MSLETDKSFRAVEFEGKELLKAQDKLVAEFEKDGDSHKLREKFRKLRQDHLASCLVAYSTDLREACYFVPASLIHDLLGIKLDAYVKRYEQDLNLLFKDSPIKNWFEVRQFRKIGSRLVNSLVIEV